MNSCGGCGKSSLKLLFSLGDVPPVNAFLSKADVPKERAHPLTVYHCNECTLVQLGEIVDPDELFSHYLHLSSASQSNIKHLKEVSDLIKRQDPSALKGKKVLEIGSNDGTLLSMCKQNAEKVLGVDPAKNLAAVAREKGVETVTGFFSEQKAMEVKRAYGSFDWVVALNVVAHTPDFTSLLRGVREMLTPDGVFVMEAAYVVETILNGQFDTVYHEHVYCFSLHALKYAIERSGLQIKDVEIIPTQGTSLRLFVCKADAKVKISDNVAKILNAEKEKGFTTAKVYETAAQKIKQFSVDLNKKLNELKKRGGRIVGLGAPARGVVILNYCKITDKLVDYVIDDTPLKQDKLVPGVHIPVRNWDALKESPSTVFFLLSWNYEKEMLEKLRAHVKSGVVLIPFPELKEVEIGKAQP